MGVSGIGLAEIVRPATGSFQRGPCYYGLPDYAGGNSHADGPAPFSKVDQAMFTLLP